MYHNVPSVTECFSNHLSTTLPISIEEQEAVMQLRARITSIKQMISHFGLRRQVRTDILV